MIILLNGPPRCGKDTAAKFICRELKSVNHYKLSRPLKRGVAAIYDLHPEAIVDAEANKDIPTPYLLGKSYRWAQIDLFLHLEDVHGNDVLALMAINYLGKNTAVLHVVISDAGRTAEAQAIVDYYGRSRVGLITIRRPGCNFDSDIREYVHIDCDRQVVVQNDYDLDLYETQIIKVLRDWGLVDGDN